MRLLDSRSTVAAVALLAGLLGACQSHAQEEAFLSTRVPVMRLDSVLQASDSLRLPLAAARTLLAAAADTGFATRAPKDTMTITDILAWARAEAARKRQAETEQSAAERARQDLVRRELDSTLVVTVVNKAFLAKDPEQERYEDYISLAFAYRNKGTRTINAFQGDVTFFDAFGDTIYSAHLKVDGPLRPGRTLREPERIIRYNPLRTAHQRLRNTPLSRMKVVWQSTDGIFAQP
ncbi:MAG: hypothetical protein DMD33_15830 [Gemmatimonadetes bacterium]|nr:MAG: hypothetical protein DMD33_15830 [Gemmatimonadota bacterium]